MRNLSGKLSQYMCIMLKNMRNLSGKLSQYMCIMLKIILKFPFALNNKVLLCETKYHNHDKGCFLFVSKT